MAVSLQHKILFGYVILMAVIGSMTAILLFDRARIREIEKESAEIRAVRLDINTVHRRITELATLGESVMAWDTTEYRVYHEKRMSIDTLLADLKQSCTGFVLPEQVDTLRILLSDKEHHLYRIMKAFHRQEIADSLIAEQLPKVFSQATRTRTIIRKKKGIAGWFGKKDTVTVPVPAAPQTVKANTPFIQVDLGRGTYYFRPHSDVVLEAGSSYTYTVSVTAKGLELAGCTIGGWTDGSGENGTAEDLGYFIQDDGSYTVYNANGLLAWNKAVQSDLSLNCTLTADITLTGEWTPIGTAWNNSYTGTFDGGGHTISGLTVKGSDENAGLFGYIGKDGGTVKNVVLEDVKITSDYQYGYVGGMAGINNGTIENCSVSGGSVSGYSAGGVVGQQYSGSITLCNSSATVQGTSQVGGVVGYTNYGVTLTACYATGDVTAKNNNTAGTFFAGGVVGSNGGNLTACYATGNVTGGTGSIYVGGVTGSNDSGTLTACYHATGTVSGPVEATGGVTGRNYNASVGIPVITACYWQNNQAQGIGNNQAGTTDGTTQVTDGDWQTAVTQMNAALQSAGSEWQYELTGALPKLKKQ